MARESTPDYIRRLRRKHGWTVADLGQRLGLSPRTVEGYEQGRAVPPPVRKLLKKISEKTA